MSAATLPAVVSGLAISRRIWSASVARSMASSRGLSAWYRPRPLMSASMPDSRKVSLAAVNTLAPSGIRAGDTGARRGRVVEDLDGEAVGGQRRGRARRDPGAGSVYDMVGTAVVMKPSRLVGVSSSHRSDQAARRIVTVPISAVCPTRPVKRPARVQNERVIEADRRPGILARMLGSRLQKIRELAELSYDDAAARLGRDPDWLVRVETGFVVPSPEETARILIEYGAREARVADTVIEMARRASSPPPWLAPHTSRLTAAERDVILVEAEATLAHVHGFRLIPDLVQTEEYFREIAPGVYPETDPDQGWDLLSHRQAHQPAGVTRLLDVMIDETAFSLHFKRPQALASQLRYLLELSEAPHATVRIIPVDARFWETRVHNFAVLSFAGTTDRIGVALTILGSDLTVGDKLYEVWEQIRDYAAADEEQSRVLLRDRLAALG